MTKQVALVWTIGCVGLLGCTEHHVYYHDHDGGEDDATVDHDAEVEEDGRVGDASSIAINTSISSASLADDCGSGEANAFAGDCAPAPEDCRGEECDTYCGGFCQQSNMQLSLQASGFDGNVGVEVAKVELLDSTGKTVLEELGSYEPKIWDGDTYGAWDEQLGSSTEASRVSYNLTKPDWEKHGSGEAWQTYQMTFYLRVTLVIDGKTVVLTSDEIMREPEIVT